MPTNEYKALAVGGSANALSAAAYAALTSLLANGYQSGRANSTQINTTLRQVTVAVAAIAQLMAEHQGADVLDDGSVTNFKTKLKAALDALYVPDLTPYARYDAFTGNPKQSVTTNGWQKLQGGLLFQWGKVAITPGGNVASMSLTFPRAFANGCYGVVGNADGPANTGWNPINVIFQGVNPSGCTVIADTGNNGITIAAGRSVMWHAWGYDNTI